MTDESISYDRDPFKYISLRDAAESNMIVAIKQLRRLHGFNFDEILGVFSVHLYREFSTQTTTGELKNEQK